MKSRLINYIRAGYPGLYIVSHEEQRIEAIMRDALESINKTHIEEPFSLIAWSCTDGLIEAGGEITGNVSGCAEPMEMLESFYNAPQKSIYLVRDFHVFLEDKNPLIWRRMKEALTIAKANNKTMIILGCRYNLPTELEKEFTLLDFPLPDREQLRVVLHTLLQSNGHSVKSLGEEEPGILSAASGLTTTEAENAFALSVVEKGAVCKDIVFREKCQAIKKNGLLEVVETNVTLNDIGGLEALKHWLVERRNGFSDEARAYKLPVPKGFLAVGNPGTGKSLTAKACRSVFGLPLLRLDAAKLFGSLVGQSEGNWRTVHAMAKAMAPCIFWIDEIDGLTGGAANSGQTDGGTSARVLKSAMQDIQEDSVGIYYVLTANDIDNLPAPLMQRMDGVWNVEMPNAVEREAVWSIQIAKVERNPRDFDLKKLSEKSEGYSGREIEKIVAESLCVAFADGVREPTTADIIRVTESFVPMSRTMASEIEKRTKRLEGVAKLASGAAMGSTKTISNAAPKGTRKISFTKNNTNN